MIAALVSLLIDQLWLAFFFWIFAQLFLWATPRTAAVVRYRGLLFLVATNLLATLLRFRLPTLPESTYAFALIPSTNLSTYDWRDAVFALWLIGLVFFAFSRSMQWVQLQKRLRETTPAPEWVKRHLRFLQTKLGLTKPIQLRMTHAAWGPFVVGIWRPMIVLPQTLFAIPQTLDAQQWEAILLHELAHIKNRDFLINLCLQATECLFFYSPFYRKMLRQVEEERESACDQLACCVQGSSSSLAQALINLKELQMNTFQMAAQGQTSFFSRRLQRMLERPQPISPAPRLSLVFLILVSSSLVLAQTPVFRVLIPGQTDQEKVQPLAPNKPNSEPQPADPAPPAPENHGLQPVTPAPEPKPQLKIKPQPESVSEPAPPALRKQPPSPKPSTEPSPVVAPEPRPQSGLQPVIAPSKAPLVQESKLSSEDRVAVKKLIEELQTRLEKMDEKEQKLMIRNLEVLTRQAENLRAIEEDEVRVKEENLRYKIEELRQKELAEQARLREQDRQLQDQLQAELAEARANQDEARLEALEKSLKERQYAAEAQEREQMLQLKKELEWLRDKTQNSDPDSIKAALQSLQQQEELLQARRKELEKQLKETHRQNKD